MQSVKYIAAALLIALLLLTNEARAEEEHHKRAPSGFTGVRGKKSISDDAYNEIESSNSIQQGDLTESPTQMSNYLMEKRAPSGFFGMRGKKPSIYPEEMYKRAPMGFMGMRGKKDVLDDYDYTLYESPKRAPMGFFGMRGKKFYSEPSYQNDKRSPMGFIGMRGKKDFENSAGYYDDVKRAPSGFFGMRGKKHSYGFFGMRGKKYPYEFRGKFVGVRGKKSMDVTLPEETPVDSTIGELGDDLDFNQLMLLLTEQNKAHGNQ